jgi:hypothetical protein
VQTGNHPIINFAARLIASLEFLMLAIATSAFAGHSGQKRTDGRIGAMSVLAPNDGHGFSSFSAIGRSAFMSTRPRPPAALRQYDDFN